MSSTYLLQNLIRCGDDASACSLMSSIKMLTTTGDTGDPVRLFTVLILVQDSAKAHAKIQQVIMQSYCYSSCVSHVYLCNYYKS